MKWFDREAHTRAVGDGERSGQCPGCSRAVTTFSSIMLPGVDDIGIGCVDCLCAETIERLDPRQDTRLLRAALQLSDARWRARQERPHRAARRRRRRKP